MALSGLVMISSSEFAQESLCRRQSLVWASTEDSLSEIGGLEVSLGLAPRLALVGGVRSEITKGLGGFAGLGDLALAGSVAVLEFDDEEKASSSIILEAAC